MANVDKVLEIFMDGNYFIIFLLLIVIVLIVLVLCLIKSREEYNELLRYTEKEDYLDNNNYSFDEDIGRKSNWIFLN